MADRKSTRSKGKNIPPRRGNEIRTHPLSKEEATRWERAYKKFSDEARKPLALDEGLMHLVYEYLVIEAYLLNKKSFKTRGARAARKDLESASSKLLSAINLLCKFMRAVGLPISPRSVIRGTQI